MMTLLEQTQINGRAEQERLLNENRRLNKQVSAYARQLWHLKTSNNISEE